MMFLRLGLGQLGRPLVGAAGAARRPAGVAVEARPDPVVAVEVDAPGVAARRIGVRVRAVVRHVLTLRGEVVEAVVRAVRVVRQDRGRCRCSRRSSSSPGRSRSCAPAARPSPALVVAGTHSRAWSCAWIRTPGFVPSRCLPIRRTGIVAGPRGTSPSGAPTRFWSRKSVSATGPAVGSDDAVPALVRYGCARSIRPADRVSQRRRHLRGRARRARRRRPWRAGRGPPCR